MFFFNPQVIITKKRAYHLSFFAALMTTVFAAGLMPVFFTLTLHRKIKEDNKLALILSKKRLSPDIVSMDIAASAIAKNAKAGQFIILRVCEDGERIPLTIADFDAINGTVTIIFAEVGLTTKLLGKLDVGYNVLDIVGPLGVPTHFPEDIKTAAVIGGGLGCAIAWPQAKALAAAGVAVDVIAGFKTKELVILEDELAKTGALTLCTDDGSAGFHGFVTQALSGSLAAGKKYDLAVAIGPLPMMKAVCDVTWPSEIPTVVSMNPIMIDGTGMCGGCRLTVGGQVKFACVDGPDFDGHKVDFAEAMTRLATYRDCEKCKMEELLK